MKEKPQPPLGLDMPFDEALARFIGTAPSELPDSLQKERRPKPPPKDADEKDPEAPA
ncbi:hypothetical protein [Sphingomonas bacterium]|uniref:hypothetical protein n=1 Tax=Sphingomonas bacterium TaxID=1895847 RepID=UPI0026108B41|nr:hypothetical protein [Sphingomonas bacterium]MDB5678471.1 hypothetical protein [Sphingomonas bacterium]